MFLTSHAHSHLWPGVPLALTSAVLFGIATPASKLLLDGVDPQLIAGVLYLGAGIGLAAVHLGRAVFGLEPPEAPLRRADLPWLAGAVLLGGVAAPLLLMLGLARTSAANGSLLLNLEGLSTMVIAWLAFRENVDRRLLLGAAAILLGALLLSWQGQGIGLDAGGVLIAAACIGWGIDNNLTRKLSAADPVITALIKGLAAGGVNLILAFLRGAALPPPGTVAAAAGIGFLAIGVSLVLFVLALRHLGSARTGAYFSLAPFIGGAVAVAFLGDPLTGRVAGAGLLMALGLWLHLAERHEHEHEHGAMEHDHRHVHDEHHRHVHEGPATEPHAHPHRHEPLRHKHVHYPDLHHQHEHG